MTLLTDLSFSHLFQEENNYLERRLKTLTYMVENLKEELTNKEDLFAHEKQGKLNYTRNDRFN